MIASLGYRRYKTTIGELELFVGVRKRGFRRIVRLKGTSEYILKFRSKAIFAIWANMIVNVKQKIYDHYHRFRWYATLENKTPAETFQKCPSVLRGGSLKMISSPYCAVSELNVYKHHKRLTRWNANRCYSLRITYLIFETFQTLFPTASLIFTAVKVFIKWYIRINEA